jgi:hypothetical protein
MDWTRTRRLAAMVVTAGVILVGATTQAWATPRPPHLPRNFRGQGVWIVRDMGITVPFSWRGRDGNFRMVAGGPDDPIWFTNLIWHNTAYTLTYRWPNVTDHRCHRVEGFFNLHLLNQAFKTGRFVGRETLHQRGQRRQVNHWRVGLVLPNLPPGIFLRFPIALGDIYVDRQNRGTFWQVLQFGFQNLYDPELDEWLRMDTFRHKPGQVGLPARCPPPLN